MIADFNPETGQLDIYNGNQAPHAHRTVYAQVAGLAEHMIRIRCGDIGGGFGNKVPVYPGYVCAIAGSIVAGVPVKWIEDRSENLMSTGFARDYIMKSEICAKDGKITGLRVDVIADHGAFDSTAQPTKFPAGFFHIVCGSYDLAASHVKVKAVYTNKAPGGVAYRCSFRITEAVYLVERMVDALALEMKVDPIDLRMRSFIGADQFPYETTTGWTYDSGDYHKTMQVAMDIAGYEDLRTRAGGEAREGRADGHRRRLLHRGRRRRPAQAHGHPRAVDERRRGPARASVAARPSCRSARADPGPGPRDDVRADRRRGAGHPARGRRGPPRRHRQVAVRARHLRLALDAGIRRRRGGGVAQGARQGARDRGHDARGLSPRTWPGRRAAGTSRATASRAPRSSTSRKRAYCGDALPEGFEGGLDAQVIYDPPNLTYPYGAYIAVVDVDPETAHVKVRRFIAVDDCGVRINPMIVEGQIHGGLAEGIGIALMEVITFDEEGNCLNSSFMDYLIPTALETPDFELGETVTPCPHHPLGAKGVGESPNVGSPPAIVNAVIDALHETHGVDHIDMPCTPARVWAAMQGRPTPPQ